ncbi:MAG: hypothetical protein MH825_12630 [Cyanobacteria bacterium]|nr:hypothetical protein [Cyanobacteriota bacterium]
MTDTNQPNESSNPNPTGPAVSAETKALVEQRMPHETDEVRYHMMALIEAIKKQAETQIESTGNVARDAYVEAIRQAQATLEKTGGFFNDQSLALGKTVAEVEDQATDRWETLLTDVQKVGNRFERVINAAWTALTEPDEPPAAKDATVDVASTPAPDPDGPSAES